MNKRRAWWGDYRTTEYHAIDPEATPGDRPGPGLEPPGPPPARWAQ